MSDQDLTVSALLARLAAVLAAADLDEIPCLGLTEGVAALRGACRSDGVLGVALAPPPSTLTVRPVNLHDPDPLGMQVAGEPGAVAAGPLDTDELDLTEAGEPAKQLLVAIGGRLEGLHAEFSAALVERGGNVDIEVGVDTSGDPQWHRGRRSSLRRERWRVAPHPQGRRDRTAKGL